MAVVGGGGGGGKQERIFRQVAVLLLVGRRREEEPRWATGGRDPLLFRTCEMAHISHLPRDVWFLWEMFGFVHLDIRSCQLVWDALARVQHLEAKNHSQSLLRSSFFRLPRCLSRGEGRRK